MSAAPSGLPVVARNVWRIFKRRTGDRVRAVVNVSLEVREGTLVSIVGPDGAGKTTLLRLMTGLVAPTYGELEILGHDVVAAPQSVQERVGYMPQRFGLYEDLSVQENLDLYADVHGIGQVERTSLYSRLMRMTALGPFRGRLAGRLSGGMKQKLGLACTLVRSPRLLLLDEPTVGVDPLSRRELWDILLRLVKEEGISIVLTTSYLDEAERCDRAIVMRSGSVLVDGTPAEITAEAAGRTFYAAPGPGQTARALQAQLASRQGIVDAVPSAGQVRFVTARPHSGVRSLPPRFEDGFMTLLHRANEETWANFASPGETTAPAQPSGLAVEVRELVRKFGSFTAVDKVSFDVRRGEVFGLLGANGAGKTTTFKMLCGLLPATSGSLRVAGADLRRSRAEARERLGYMAQKFALYSMLTVRENLDFFSRAYGLGTRRARERVDWAIEEFALGPFVDLQSGELPGGYKQRLALAAALLHEPEMLFLDEPTSGADPLARREFWSRINVLAQRGITVIVTTHFLEEAEYCDRVLILESGRVLTDGTPAEIRRRAAGASREVTMEEAFVAIVSASRSEQGAVVTGGVS